ncbi:MAG: YIP1 family protein, partial [Pyrinomonadaceae bacterium]
MSEQNFAKQIEPTESMSLAETLTTGIFFEPARTFEALRNRLRFLVAGLLVIVLSYGFFVTFAYRVGYENIARAQIEASSRTVQLTPEQKELAIQTQSRFRIIAYVTVPIVKAIGIAIGGALFFLGVIALGKKFNYSQGLSVWTYSSLPPAFLSILISLVVLFVKAPEDLDLASTDFNLAHANLGILVDSIAHPIIGAFLGSFDLFVFYGLFLAAVGIKKMSKLSSGGSWAIVITIWFITA